MLGFTHEAIEEGGAQMGKVVTILLRLATRYEDQDMHPDEHDLTNTGICGRGVQGEREAGETV